MNDLARRAFALVFAFLLVTSIPFAVVELGGPDVSPVGTTSATNHVVDDFEDGDTTVKSSDWTGWSGDTGSFSATTDAISGDHSGRISENGGASTVTATADSPVSPSRVGFRLRSSSYFDPSDQTRVQLRSSGTAVMEISFGGTGSVEANGNAVSHEWNPNVVYTVEFRNIDWGANTTDVYLNGDLLGNFAFQNSASSIDDVNFVVDGNSGTGAVNVDIDDVEIGGSNFDISTTSAGDSEDFEHGTTDFTVTGWSDFTGATGSLSTAADPIKGDGSLVLTAGSGGTAGVTTHSESGSYSFDTFSTRIRLDDRTGATTDNSRFLLKDDGGTTIVQIRFSHDGDVEAGGPITDTGKNWAVGAVYEVELRNIDYSSDTYDLYVDGDDLGTYSFFNSGTDFDEVQFYTDADDGSTSVPFVVDDVTFGAGIWSDGEWSAGLTDDFEHGNTTIQTDDWGGWEGTIEIGTMDGSQAGGLVNQSAGTVRRFRALSEQGSADPSSVSTKIYIEDMSSDDSDDVHIYLKQQGTEFVDIRFYAGSEATNDLHDLYVNDNTDTGVNWAPETVNTVELRNIDWSANTFDLYLNGTDLGTYNFSSSASGFDEFEIESDQNQNTLTATILLDDVSLGTHSVNTTSGSVVSGTVENQNGDPVSGATVQVWGVDYDQISGGKDTATDLIEDAKNKTPTEWTEQIESDFRLTGSGGHFREPDVVYAAVHSVDDWKVSPTTDRIKDNPTLESPELSIDASRGETVTLAVSAWDGDKFQLRNAISPVRNDLHGEPIEASIVIETLVAPDDTIEKTQTTKTEINCNFIGCDWSSAFVEVQLTPGFYRVYVEGHAEDSYVIKVGDPVEIILEDLKNEQNQVAEQASEVTQNLDDGKFTKTTTTTASDGSWSVNVGSSVNTVAIQAYKAPDVAENSSSLTYEDIIAEYEAAYEDGEQVKRLGAVYLPSEVRSVDPPQSDVTLTVEEVSFPQLADRENLEQRLKDLFEELLNETLTQTFGPFLENIDDVDRADLETLYQTLVDLYEQNQDLQDQIDEDDTVIVDDPSDVSDEELQDAIDDIYDELERIGDQVDGDVEEEIGTDTISQTWTFGSDIREDSLTLLIHWSNGSTTTLDTESEYLRINKRAGLGDQVLLEDYPINSTDPGSLTFELLGVGEANGEIVREKNTVRNPRFDGNIPSLNAIQLTSLEPGPSEQVDIELHPRDVAQFGSIVSATVTGPGGSDISTDAISSNGRVTGFKTSGSGVYHVALTFNNSDGDQFTETIRVFADEFDDSRPPSAQVRTGPTGRYLVVGDGLESGSIDVGDGGEISVAAQISQDSDVPGTVQLYLQDVDTGSRTEVTVSVVRGESESRVSQRVGVILHMNEITDTAVLYREGSEPLPRNGSNAAGEVAARSNGSTIQSFTEADGRVTILVENDPGILDRALYRVRSFNIPIVSVSPAADLAEVFVEPLELGSLLEGAIA